MSNENEQIMLSGSGTKRFEDLTNTAHTCAAIVKETAVKIGSRAYVQVEGWTSIAATLGYIATIKTVEEIPSGVRAIAQLKRISDGFILSEAEGFVGKDETTWYGGKTVKYFNGQEKEVDIPKRADYAIRAMAQTRAISRVCRTAFALVVVLMKAGLSTVPAEEMASDEDPTQGVPQTDAEKKAEEARAAQREAARGTETAAGKSGEPKLSKEDAAKIRAKNVIARAKYREQFKESGWRKVKVHFGNAKGKLLADLEIKTLCWFVFEWVGSFRDKPATDEDLIFGAACDQAAYEANLKPEMLG